MKKTVIFITLSLLTSVLFAQPQNWNSGDGPFTPKGIIVGHSEKETKQYLINDDFIYRGRIQEGGVYYDVYSRPFKHSFTGYGTLTIKLACGNGVVTTIKEENRFNSSDGNKAQEAWAPYVMDIESAFNRPNRTSQPMQEGGYAYIFYISKGTLMVTITPKRLDVVATLGTYPSN